MKKSTATLGRSASVQIPSVRKTKNLKKVLRKKKTDVATKVAAIITAVLVVCLTGTILYTQFYKAEVDRFFAKKYTVIDETGAKVKYTAEELAEEVKSDRFYQGIKVDGVDLSDKTLDEAKAMFKDTREKQVDDIVDIEFQIGDEQVRMKTDGMTLSSNIDEVLTEAFNYAKTSPLEGVDGLKERYEQITSLKTTPKEYNSVFTIGYDNVSALTHDALDSFNINPVEAKATGFDVKSLSFLIEDSKAGQSVDIEKAIAEVNDLFSKEKYQAVVPIDVSVVEPQTSAESLRSKFGRISSNSSKTADSANRNTNIWLVCQKLDGMVLQPGEQFNFNKFIGERTPERGFKEAPGIYYGASRLEYGGGICQANTMLYHSVMEADLQVDERVPHSWASDYVDAGTDATVTWDGANFRFTNNTEYPIAIHAYYGDRWVTVEIYGRLLPEGQKIKFFGDPVYIVDEAPTRTEYVADPTLAVGSVVKERSAHNHVIARAYKVKYDADGNEIKRDEIQTEYPLIIPKYRVGTLGPDGTIYHMNPETGKVTAPDGYVPPTQSPEPTPTPGVSLMS
ncbi:MAG: VanW family protein [Clostridiales bacterium]|nr:VanW family protein [Clostridiales bacterium]